MSNETVDKIKQTIEQRRASGVADPAH